MKKIAILGCENSHADQFLGFIQNDPRYADAEVVGIYSEEADAAARLADRDEEPDGCDRGHRRLLQLPDRL